MSETLVVSGRNRGKPYRQGYTHERMKQMAMYAADLRRTHTTAKYAVIVDMVREKFGCGITNAERAMKIASELVREEMLRWYADAPAKLWDAYWSLYEEARHAGRHNDARKALDSLRDMFGLKTAVQLHVTTNAAGAPGPETLRDLSDDELAVLAKLDATRVIDAASVERVIDDADADVDAADDDDDDEG